MTTLIFIVVDAGSGSDRSWAKSLHGPKASELFNVTTSTTLAASVRDEFDALDLAVSQWKGDLVRYRCGLPGSAVSAYRGSAGGWNCRDIRLVVQHLSFADVDPATEAKLNDIPTRLRLPVDQVDLLIGAGRKALEVNPDIQAAVAAIRARAGVRPATIATAAAD